MGLRGPDDFWLLLDAILLGGFAGGRLGYLATDPGLPPFQWRDLVFPLTSGFSAFGVFAGMAAGVLVLCRLRRLPLGRVADHLGVAMPFWMATSRLGCHLTGCCQGRPAGPSWPWTVTFTDPASACPPALLGVPAPGPAVRGPGGRGAGPGAGAAAGGHGTGRAAVRMVRRRVPGRLRHSALRPGGGAGGRGCPGWGPSAWGRCAPGAACWWACWPPDGQSGPGGPMLRTGLAASPHRDQRPKEAPWT